MPNEAMTEVNSYSPSMAASVQPRAPVANSCSLVIFGADGDLTKRLLTPALYNLASGGLLPDDFKVVGVDRGKHTEDAWKDTLAETMRSFTKDKASEFYTPHLDETAWAWLSDRMHYVQGDFTRSETFGAIGQVVGDDNAIFYLAVSSRFFGQIVEALGKAGLMQEAENTFRRVVIEKPFGSDLASGRR